MYPDLYPGQTQEKKDLFINAIKAYKNGDLETIRLIYTMQGEFPLPNTKDDATKSLYREKERLKKIVDNIQKEIASIKSSFPYTMQEFLNDKDKVEAKKKELTQIIEQYQEMSKAYYERIKAMLE